MQTELAKLNNEFYGNWNPFNIFKIEDLQNEIMKMGDNFRLSLQFHDINKSSVFTPHLLA